MPGDVSVRIGEAARLYTVEHVFTGVGVQFEGPKDVDEVLA